MQNREVKAVLFDLDGVLVDSLNAWFNVFNETLKHFGLKALTRNEFKKDFGAPIEHDMKKYFKGLTIKEVKTAYIKYFNKDARHVKLFPESVRVLKSLKERKVKIGLISNSARAIVLAILNHYKLKKYFKAIVTMDDARRRKPAPDMILKACRILKVHPRDTILVGDTKNDMIAGKRAGCITVGYKTKGDYRINRLIDVNKTIIKRQSQKLL